LAKVKSLRILERVQKPPYSAFAVVRNVEIFVPLDRSKIEEEGKRLQKEISKIEKEIAFVDANSPMNSSSPKHRRMWFGRKGKSPPNTKPFEGNWRKV